MAAKIIYLDQVFSVGKLEVFRNSDGDKMILGTDNTEKNVRFND